MACVRDPAGMRSDVRNAVWHEVSVAIGTRGPGGGAGERRCADARKFTRFSAFGLTLRSEAPTVTVRNRYF